MIKVENLVKRYGATVAVNNVSFEVEKGEIIGFLGPNGAGKSTTLKIVTCYIVADEGQVSVAGLDALENPLEVRRQIGYLPESTPLYPDMQVIEYLRFIAKARQLPASRHRSAIDRVVGLVGIERMLKKNIGHLSKGYKQRVGLAQALIHDPPIIIMDEPTSGLDPHQIIEIRELIRELGRTKVIVLSSHILQEISAICTRILIIKDGRIVANGTPAELQSQVLERQVLSARIQGPEEAVRERLQGTKGIERVEIAGHADGFHEFRVYGSKGEELGVAVFRLAAECGWALSSLSAEHKSLEDVYLQLTETRADRKAAG
jgi:ABC-2 type transport system ATP-binding protein